MKLQSWRERERDISLPFHAIGVSSIITCHFLLGFISRSTNFQFGLFKFVTWKKLSAPCHSKFDGGKFFFFIGFAFGCPFQFSMILVAKKIKRYQRLHFEGFLCCGEVIIPLNLFLSSPSLILSWGSNFASHSFCWRGCFLDSGLPLEFKTF